MGFLFGLVKRLVKILIYFLIFAAIVVLIPNLPPYTKFSAIPLEDAQARSGPLAPNDLLNNAEKAYVDKLLGPEAFQLYKGELYTSLATGEIVKVGPGGHITFVTKIGQPCSGLTQEHICGRPLGFQIDEAKNHLYIADAYHGIWKVDLKNDKKQLLVSPRVAIEGRVPKIFNSLALTKNGDFYWTDSSSDFHLKDGALSVLTDPSGRLFHYSAANNQSKVLLDNLWFSNGLAISPDNQFLVLSETSRFRIMKYYIDGPKKGKSEVFVAGLPGLPDNIRALPDGSGVLVGLYTTYDEENPLLMRSMAEAPHARKFLARLQRLIEIPFEYLNSIFPHVVLEDIVYYIGHFKSVSGTLPKQAGLVQIDWNGNIVASYYNTDGSLSHISDAIVYNNRLYTGNPHDQNFIGSLPVPPQLKKAFERKQESSKQAAPQQAKPVEPKVEVKREAPKPVEKQAKPVEPKVQVKREVPKPVEKQAKPVEVKREPPKPVEKQAKPVEVKREAPKPVEKQAKPVELKREAPKPVEKQAKPVEFKREAPKPVEKQAKPVEQKPTPKPVEQTKPEVKTTTPKPAPAPAKTESKSAPPKAESKPKPDAPKPQVTKPKDAQKPVKEQPRPEEIPIKEDIPSDTAKPVKETLKVIKKGGPTEIPNHNRV